MGATASVIGTAASIGSSVAGMVGSSDATDSLTSAQAANKEDLLKYYADSVNALSNMYYNSQGYNSPYTTVGESAINQLNQNLQSGLMDSSEQSLWNAYWNAATDSAAAQGIWEKYADSLGYSDEAKSAWNKYSNYLDNGFQGVEDPSIQYVQDQALKATQASAAAKGGLLSGGTQKAIEEKAGNIASTYWQEAYNNYLNKVKALQGEYSTRTAADTAISNALGNAYQTRSARDLAYSNNLGNAFSKYIQLGDTYNNALYNLAGLGQRSATNMTQASSDYAKNYTTLNQNLVSGLTGATNASASAEASDSKTQADLWGQLAGTTGNALSKGYNYLTKNNSGYTTYDSALGSNVSGSSAYYTH